MMRIILIMSIQMKTIHRVNIETNMMRRTFIVMIMIALLMMRMNVTIRRIS
jgi:hypothetical protein